MSTTIDSLELEVQSSATSAVSGIDALSASLFKLKSAVKGGVGLTSVVNQLKNLNTALQGVDASSAGKLNTLANSLQKLQGLGGLKISSSISNQITAIGTATRSLSGTDFSALGKLATAVQPLANIGTLNLSSTISQLNKLPGAIGALNSVDMTATSQKIRDLVNALIPLTAIGKSNLTSFFTQIGKLPQIVATLNSINMQQLTSQIQQLSAALAPLASQMNAVASGFAAFPARIQRLITSTNNLSGANNRTADSYVNLWAKCHMALSVVKNGAKMIASWITKSNAYIENLNLFTASMGSYAQEAQKYAESVGEIMGIDPGEWMHNQGVFNTIISGFGVASDKAYLMSQNLTQLGYDISSFFNISFEDAMQKLQSGISGELEPLRRLGYDLSVARLQQEALNLGIEKSVNDMTQAEKSQLRYYAIMTQVTVAQGDMARTLNAPANQLRVLQAQVTQCARALGNIFIPVLNAVLPYAIALAKVIRMIADVIARLFGFELPDVDYSGVSAGASSVADSVGDIGDGLGKAAKNAKKLKSYLLGIDELNVIQPPEDSTVGGGSGGGAGVGGGDLGFELPTYDFLGNAVNQKIDEIVQKMKEWLGLTDDVDTWAEFFQTRLGKILETVGEIGVGFAAWKIANGVVAFIDKLSSFKGIGSGSGILGFSMLFSDLNELVKYFEDFTQNGPTFQNVTGMLSEFVGSIGDCLVVLGSYKVGGALKVVQGISEICVAVKDISEIGINWDNATTAIRGLTNIAIGIGVFTGNIKLAAWGVAIQGFTSIIGELGENWEAIKQGDWSGVDKVTLITGGLEILGGLVVALDVFSKLKGLTSLGKANEAVGDVSTATQSLDTTVSTSLSPNLTSLAKNLGLGLVIVSEVAAAALLITGTIILLGMGLGQVGLAWQPVIDNGGTVAIAMGVGVGILAAIGVVTGLLGSIGTTLIVNLGLGIAILAEISAATDLFIAEIWVIGKLLDEVGKAWQPVLNNGETIVKAIGLGTAILVAVGVVTAALGMATTATAGALPLAIGLGTAILVELGIATAAFIAEIWGIGKGLDEVGKAWQPVLDNGETIAAGIELGTGLLIAIGVVTAALGGATVATGGLLPLAIGLGTALLVELSAALIDFTDSLVAVADELSDNLSPSLEGLNEKLPGLSDNMSDFVDFMTEFAGHVVRYTEVSAIAALSGTIDTIIGWFTEDPIEKLANDVKKTYDQTLDLNEKLNSAVPELEEASGLLSDYQTFIDQIEAITGANDNTSLSGGMFVNMKEVGQNLVIGFVDGIKSKSADFKNAAKDLIDGFSSTIETHSKTCKSSMTEWTKNIKEWFTNSSFGGINATTFSTFANNTIEGFKNKIGLAYTNTKSNITTWASNVKTWFRDINSDSAWGGQGGIAYNVIEGFKNGITSWAYRCKDAVVSWGQSVIKWFQDTIEEHSPSKVFYRSGVFTVKGYNNAVTEYGRTTKGVMEKWANSFTSFTPKLAFAVDTSALSYYDSASFEKTMSAEVTGNHVISADGFAESMEEFYREYVEPTLHRMAEDVKRQADKEEQTIVQVGNRTVTDAVVTQQKANGYKFTK